MTPPLPFCGALLVVDDEQIARTVSARMLERLGFDVVSACDGDEALALFSREPARFVGVLLDLTMPRMDGDVCLRELRRIRADLPVVLASGNHADDVAPSLTADDRTTFLQKPYRMADLAAKLREVLAPSGPQSQNRGDGT